MRKDTCLTDLKRFRNTLIERFIQNNYNQELYTLSKLFVSDYFATNSLVERSNL